ncbi:hypothetical protein [Pseudarthrobacter sp. PvP090]|uniref:hypothetical protein n=1 Tax=Pseudarthrobacter sp. PvP090 TaxID=3156393 RepID=UPI0033964361
MTYDGLELLGFWALSIFPAAALVVLGVLIHRRSSGPRQMSRYLFGGIGASILYAMFAGVLAARMFPPSFDPYFSSGRGLDLRGIGFVLGGFAGGASGAATAFLAFITSKAMTWHRQRNAKPQDRTVTRD